jgi:hypothetical protein
MSIRPRDAESGIFVSAHGTGLTILDTVEWRVFVSNETGARIWAHLSAGLTIEEISNEIAGTFSISPEQAKQSVRAFVQELDRQALLVRRSA